MQTISRKIQIEATEIQLFEISGLKGYLEYYKGDKDGKFITKKTSEHLFGRNVHRVFYLSSSLEYRCFVDFKKRRVFITYFKFIEFGILPLARLISSIVNFCEHYNFHAIYFDTKGDASCVNQNSDFFDMAYLGGIPEKDFLREIQTCIYSSGKHLKGDTNLFKTELGLRFWIDNGFSGLFYFDPKWQSESMQRLTLRLQEESILNWLFPSKDMKAH